MPFTVSHIGVVPAWGRLRPTPGPVLLAMASGSVTPDLLRSFHLPNLGIHDRGLLSSLLVGFPVSVMVLVVTSALLIPAWSAIAPVRMAGLGVALESARIRDGWKRPSRLMAGLAAGIVSHVVLDTLTHEPPIWMPGSGLATWVPFSIDGDPYPVYFILQFLLSAVGIAVLLVGAHRLNAGSPAGDGIRSSRTVLQFGLLVAAGYGAFGTQLYSRQVTARSFSDITADVGVGATAGVTAGLCLIGLALGAARRWAPPPAPTMAPPRPGSGPGPSREEPWPIHQPPH
ncbi:MAG: DUF4184 family protein [Actinomycetia bacterium]|nr:DUF4184 family protein [Actinomycetes bacterium]